ncbi:hypothetical protein [Novosphingobium sp. ZW T3_23]|uniref:hypothetical protein n=1 Tax=Novosphingobium sp. ZW T3_23 TaxID=3378084 RepID=UPI0038530936
MTWIADHRDRQAWQIRKVPGKRGAGKDLIGKGLVPRGDYDLHAGVVIAHVSDFSFHL